jgi:hypothetical protein
MRRLVSYFSPPKRKRPTAMRVRLTAIHALKRRAVMLTLSIALALTSCALFLTKESRYLRAVVDHASESEIREHLGTPADVAMDGKGRAVWTYQRRRHVQQGTNNAWTTVDAWQCDIYTLNFDEHRILRDWTRTSLQC